MEFHHALMVVAKTMRKRVEFHLLNTSKECILWHETTTRARAWGRTQAAYGQERI
jgi:hypothetical protein